MLVSRNWSKVWKWNTPYWRQLVVVKRSPSTANSDEKQFSDFQLNFAEACSTLLHVRGIVRHYNRTQKISLITTKNCANCTNVSEYIGYKQPCVSGILPLPPIILNYSVLIFSDPKKPYVSSSKRNLVSHSRPEIVLFVSCNASVCHRRAARWNNSILSRIKLINLVSLMDIAAACVMGQDSTRTLHATYNSKFLAFLWLVHQRRLLKI